MSGTVGIIILVVILAVALLFYLIMKNRKDKPKDIYTKAEREHLAWYPDRTAGVDEIAGGEDRRAGTGVGPGATLLRNEGSDGDENARIAQPQPAYRRE
jgi:hypothetical protein